jgi:5-formyltetrahydrofolate cyclo-ligase
LLAARTSLAAAARSVANAAMADRVEHLPFFEEIRTVLGYVAMGAEADPRGILLRAHQRGIPVLVPSDAELEGDPRWKPWGPSPPPEVPEQTGTPDSLIYPFLVLVPGVGFDLAGTRLGRGRGYYDSALAALRRSGQIYAVGLAFECQIVAELPSAAWDQRVNCIVSERRVLVTANPIDLQSGATSR